MITTKELQQILAPLTDEEQLILDAIEDNLIKSANLGNTHILLDFFPCERIKHELTINGFSFETIGDMFIISW